ncbi:unnamed protein product [Rotaria sordida]|uniref:Vacuolar protein sorting-associated protein 13A n=2 Tax=Rotaria sordida TaxID=392033 RepID=A0A815VAK2_9BILA|nr:unnamed protein product [Rotaria sordida]CAF1529968.1 unnamed protein product [Rotaria sordida]
MVFEQLTTYLIDKFLGDYIEDLDSKQLKIDLWHGDVVLENLSLKPNALANFNLPVTVAVGHLQKLSLHIPWKQLYTHPTKITIDGLYLLLTPKTDIEYDPEREEQKRYEEKMEEVHKVEQFRKEIEAYEKNKTVSKRKDTFMERLQLHILRNLILSISNIHIAYEDKTTKPDHPFSFGITLNYTTNTEWEPMVSKEESPIVYKLGELNALSIYWNSDIKSRSELSQENIVDILQAKIVKNEQTSNSMTYILQPLNINIKLKMATTPREQDYVRPVFDAKIDVHRINLNINRNQYCDLLDLFEFQDHLNSQSKFIKYYAMIENDATDKPSLRRWKFAYTVILNEEVRPRLASYKWENIKANRDRFREYHELYYQELTGNASKTQKQLAEELEKKIDVFNLIFIRRTVEIEIKKKKAEQKQKSWLDKMTSWWSSDSDDENSEFNIDGATAAEEKKKLYDAIGYAEDDGSLAYPEEYVDIDLSIRLTMLEINVWSNINEKNLHFIIDLHSFEVFGVGTDTSQIKTANVYRPVLAKPADQIQLAQKHLLHIEYETNPLDRPSENRIQVLLQSLEITYDALTINKLVEFFQPDRKRDLQSIKEIAYSTFNDIKYRTRFLFNHYLKNIQASDIDIDLQSSFFLLPEDGVYRRDCHMLSLDFGHFTFKGGPSYNDEEIEIGKTYENIINIDDPHKSSYFPLKLRLENIRLLYIDPNDDWQDVRTQHDSSMNIIKPITVFVNIHKYIYSENSVLPTWKLDVQVSAIDARVSDAHIFGIIQLFQSIQFPELKEESVETETFVEVVKEQHRLPHKTTAKKRVASKPKRKNIVKSDSTSVMPTFQIEVDLKGLRAIIGFELFQVLDIQSQGFRAHILNSTEKTSAYLVFTDLYVFDPNPKARYRHIISQQGIDKQLLRIDFTRLNYPKNDEKTLNDIDCDVKIQLTKLHMVLLYKHMDLILNLLNAFQTKKTEHDVSSNQPSTVFETMEYFQKQARKLRLDVMLNAPSILIPTSSYSNEGLFIDLGQLTMQTKFTDDPNRSLVEQQVIVMNNLLASRVKLGKTNEIFGSISLLECSELSALIDRLLYPEKVQHEPEISIVVNWDSIQFTLAKDDYATLMKIFKKNFSEKFYHKISKPAVQEQYEYRRMSQSGVIVTKKKEDNINRNKISKKIHFNAEIKKIAITLYLDESNVITRHESRNENSKFFDLQLKMLKAQFRQLSDSSYAGQAQIQELILDDLRVTNRSNKVTHMINRSFNVDPNVPMFTVTLEYKTNNKQNSMGVRQTVSKTDGSLHTKVKIIIKTPKIILLEDQYNKNSNCFVLDFASKIHIDMVNDYMTMYGLLKDLTIYGSNFAALKNSKIEYRVLQPVDIDLILILDLEQQHINVRIGDIGIQIPPAAVHTVLNMINSMGELQTTARNETEKINSKGIFDPKPFKDASFWFIKDYEMKQEFIEQRDVLELTTGTPSHKKATIEEANKRKEIEEQFQTRNIRSQHLILNLNMIEIKLELGTGSATKPVIAMCLSNLFVGVKNWSSDISISSQIHIELALFNDNLLSWEPLIEPVIDKSGEVVCPWCITCSTSIHEDEEEVVENDDESRFLLDEPNSPINTVKYKDGTKILDAKHVIYIRADHPLNITVTKTMLNLAQRLSTTFKDAYNKRLLSDEDDDKSLLSIHNMTGYDVYIENITGVKFLDDKKFDTPIHLKHLDSIPLTVPGERLSATHIPAISEQMINRKQEFSVKIPCYNNAKWISEPIDLKIKSNNSQNDYPVIFFNVNTQEKLKLLLRVQTYRESYRASLYSPYWIVNCTDLKFEFKVEGEKTLIEVVDLPFYVCPSNFDKKKKKGQIRLFSLEEDATLSEWSESFSLDVIKSTGIAACKVSNDRTYMVCIDIVTSSFGMTKILTLAPSTIAINKSTIEIEVAETLSQTEEEYWRSVNPEGIIPFWPRNMQDGVMRVRYTHNRISSTAFVFNQKHRTLLRMDDEERPALQVEIIATDFDGFRIVFGDYTIGDSPVLLVNCLKHLPIALSQAEDVRTQVLRPLHYVYYTWIDPLKPQALVIACLDHNASIELNVAAAPTINMDSDLKRIHKPLQAITEAQSSSQPAEPKLYFDNMHLSPLKIHGAMEGPVEFIEGIAIGTQNLVASAVGGVAGATSKITGVASKGLATLTFDEDYEKARIARKEVSGHRVSDVVLSGKNVGKDIVHGITGVVKKPMAGAKETGARGFVKGLGKGFLGLIARPASGIADFASTSLDLIKRIAVHEEVVHRVRSPRHVGRDGIVRPSTAHERRGFYILHILDNEKHTKSDSYIAHIDCSEDPPTWLMATSQRLLFLTGTSTSSNVYKVEWDCHYKELKEPPVVKFQPNEIQIVFKEPKLLGLIKKDEPHEETVPYRNTGEARYIVDKITQVMRAMEL